jgi:putative FmdB family regulatory protein
MIVIEGYKCAKCGHIFEELVEKTQRDERLECPECKALAAERIVVRNSTHAMKSTWRP